MSFLRAGPTTDGLCSILQQLQRVESQIARLPMPVSTQTPRSRDSAVNRRATGKREGGTEAKAGLDKLGLAQENEDCKKQLGEAEQVIRIPESPAAGAMN